MNYVSKYAPTPVYILINSAKNKPILMSIAMEEISHQKIVKSPTLR